MLLFIVIIIIIFFSDVVVFLVIVVVVAVIAIVEAFGRASCIYSDSSIIFVSVDASTTFINNTALLSPGKYVVFFGYSRKKNRNKNTT